MKIINYKRGYIQKFDCVIEGTIEMNREEFGQVVNYLYTESGTIKQAHAYFSPERLKDDLARRIFVKDKKGEVTAFLINIRVSATDALVEQFKPLGNYKRANYMIRVVEQERIRKNRYGEFISCMCGNTAMDSGFYPCDELGNEVVPDNDWNGNLYVCFDCGRIVNQWSGKIVGRAVENAIRL